MKAKRYAMTMDTKRCVACQACVLSCKAENDLPDKGFRDWIVQETRGEMPTLSQENRSERCNHCDNPSCVSACPTGASYVGPGGTVLVNQHKCSGCKACIAACPYNARYVHDEGYIDKCTFCMHRVQKGEEPGCVDVCPTRALHFGDLSDPQSNVSEDLKKRRHKVLEPERGLDPHLFFLV
ncbi:MAG: tetrathionate reductase [Deltaproteobacteria bacterium RIFOXYA12_FULL_58_15]|nr:MAG: tetrathionate reductase [Deltaproteobacteria bacterium RIFOXYA12_FULL_58_15]OGR10291.1 MAG: tetrathionate reductase [Deltaproteobacteria bacterium RIFOXYB12_FULL_58_9]